MKMPWRKPRASVVEMVPIEHTIRRWPGSVLRTATFHYPDGHPMRRYKDLKKALKAYRRSLCK